MGKNTGQQNSKDAKQKNSLIEKITPLARQINCLDIQHIADICVKKLPELLNVRFASLYILDELSNILHLKQYNHPFLLNKIVSLSQNPPSPMVMAVKSKKLILTNNINKHDQPPIKISQRAFSENYETNNCVIVPLVCHEKVVGVLNLSDKLGDNGYSSEDIAMIQLFGELIGASIGNISLFNQIQYQATTDGLTGLVNHKTFYEMLEKELWRARRYNNSISLIMIDIDNLKVINDTYGHRAGDRVITEISAQIKKCIRQIDTGARYGGDEFAVILPNTSLSDAHIAAERMLNMVAKLNIKWKQGFIRPSVSIGLGEYDSNTNPEDITSRSDDALYMAKKSGRNKVYIYTS